MESWSQAAIFHSGDEFFDQILLDIREARHSITIEAYIFSIDRLTERLLEELGRARTRGCQVKIVVDGFGSYGQIPQLSQLCALRGIELRVFHPFPYMLFGMRKWFWGFSTSARFFLKRMNRRNHRKIVIIDERRAYLGSFNFTQDHCESLVGPQAWRDTGVWVEGPPLKQLVLAFQITYLRTYVVGMLNWVGRWSLQNDPFQSCLRLNTTQRMRRRLFKDLLQRIGSARTRIYITTAYFLPKRSLLRALLKAARRGVDVKLLIPGKSDVPMVKWAAFNIIRFLLRRQISIYEYQKSILHAKTMIIDNDVFIGSFNLNHRSIMHDLEVEVVLKDKNSLENMLGQWQTDICNAKLATEKDFTSSSWLARLIYSIAFRMRYML